MGMSSRGYYTLDRFRYHAHEQDNSKDNKVSNSFSKSKFNPAKRVRFFWVSGHSLQEQLQKIDLRDRFGDFNSNIDLVLKGKYKCIQEVRKILNYP